MKKVLLVKNITREGPGLLAGVLSDHSINYDTVDLGVGRQFPDPTDYSAVFVFGGPDSANDGTLKMKQELARIKQAVDLEIPFLGVCLGMQTLVKAMGGEVYRNPVIEIGWRDPEGKYFEVELTEAGKSDPLFSGVSSPYNIFHLHGETVILGPGTELLGRGKWCENQAVRVKGKSAYGIQGHLELTPGMFEEWVAQDPDLLKLDAHGLRRDYNELRSAYEKQGMKTLTNFLRVAGLI